MPTVEREPFPEEAPTRKVDPIPARTLILASKIDRMAEEAAELLAFGGEDAVPRAAMILASIRLTVGELR